jgi:hypothetical protein
MTPRGRRLRAAALAPASSYRRADRPAASFGDACLPMNVPYRLVATTLHADNQAGMVRAGAMEALVVLLRGDGGEEMKTSAAGSLRILAGNSGECEECVFQPLYRRGMCGASAVDALRVGNVTIGGWVRADNDAALLRAGAIEALVALLRGDGGEEIKTSAADALRNLSCCPGEGAACAAWSMPALCCLSPSR